MAAGRWTPPIVMLLSCLVALALCLPLRAQEVRYFNLQTRQDFLAGSLDGLALGALGTLRLSDRAELVSDIEAPFLFRVARHPEGWVLGTGNDGRVLLLYADGTVDLLLDAEEPEVFAVLVADDGSVYAGTSPNGKVYRIREGEVETVFSPGEVYIWDLAEAKDGSLLIATGTNGRLFRLSQSGESETLFDDGDPHLRSMLVLSDGTILLGTAGSGQIVAVEGDSARTLFDSDRPEIVAMAADGSGGFFAAAISSRASLVETVATAVPSKRGEKGEEDQESQQGEAEVTVLLQGAAADKVAKAVGRARRKGGPRSVLLHGGFSGRVKVVEELQEETVHSLLWLRDRLWIGTGQEGKLFTRSSDGEMQLAQDVDERQVIGLTVDTPGPVFATTNAAAVYRITEQSERQGTFTSAALDAGHISRFGRLHWEGERSGGAVEFSLRSGMSSVPDDTWSEWTSYRAGNELALEAVEPARFLQFRTRFQADDGRSPRIRRVTISYVQQNLPPRITALQVLAPGQVRVPRGFNPKQDDFEPGRPDESGFFTPITASDGEKNHTKSLWKQGYRTLTWEAEDPNGDELLYSLSFRPEGENSWFPMQSEWEETVFPFDSTVLPDGVYRFRVTAVDRAPDDEASAATDVRISQPVTVDNSVPTLLGVKRDDDALIVEVGDEWSPLRRIALSVDAGAWRELRPSDGLVDGLQERLRIIPPTDSRILLLRVEDAAHNAVTVALRGPGGG